MSDQNQFEEYKKKFLQYLNNFLTACAALWEKVKVNTGDAVSRLRERAIQLARKLAAYALSLRERIRNSTLVQQVKEKIQSGKQQKTEAVPESATVQELPQASDAMEFAVEEPQQPDAVEDVQEAEPADEKVRDERTLMERAKPYLLEVGAFFGVIGKFLKFMVKWIWKLRKVIMAVPVVWTAVKLAMENMDRLPEQVGLDIQSTGEFARMVSRDAAVYGPLAITAFCLLLMFCAKKPVLPWVISIFTLVLPWLIWLTNYYA